MSADAIESFRKSHVCELAEAFSNALVESGALTQYQAGRILNGETRGLVLGDYLILETIGAGGMGQVYLAEHRRMGRRVALKTLPSAVADDERKVLRFQQEVRAAAKLSHSNIVTAYDAGEDHGIHYFVMEFVEGVDLSRLVKQNGPLSAEQSVDLILQAAKGLAYAHDEGVVHRDIKPANLLFCRNGELKILDMGLARIETDGEQQDAGGLTHTGMMMGTVDYMSPEQAIDSKDADARSDIYSLGCVLHFLMIGKSVYSGDTVIKKIFAHRDEPVPLLSALRQSVPAALDAILVRMIAKKPDDRFQNMTEVIDELRCCGIVETAAHASLNATFPFGETIATQVGNPERRMTPTMGLEFVGKETFVDEQNTTPASDLEETINADSAGQIRHTPTQQWLGPRVAILVGAFLLVVGSLVWVAGIRFHVKTSIGTIIIEVDQPELAGAVVSVDGQQKVTITAGQGKKPIEVVADDKSHTLRVTKDGFEAFVKSFTVRDGGHQTISVTLDPIANDQSEKTAVTDPPAMQTAETVEDPQRRAVEIALREGNGFSMWSTSGVTSSRDITNAEQLPKGRFGVVFLDLHGMGSLSDSDWKTLTKVQSLQDLICKQRTIPAGAFNRLSALRTLHLGNCEMSRESLSGISQLTDLHALVLYSNPAVTDETCDEIGGLEELRELNLNNTSVTGRGLKTLAKLPSLHTLSISVFDSIAAEDLASLQSCESLRSLAIQRKESGSGNELVRQLGDLSQLRLIDLGNFASNDVDVFRLQEQLPNCAIIHPDLPTRDAERDVAQWIVDHGGGLIPHGSSSESTAMPLEPFSLKAITIFETEGVSPELSGLAKLRALEGLHWYKMASADTKLVTVGKLPTLRNLTLSYSDVTSIGIEHLRGLDQLEVLTLKQCAGLTDGSLRHLANLDHLRSLNLMLTAVSNGGLIHVAKVVGLRILTLDSCPNVTSDGLASLAELPWLRDLNLDGTSVSDSGVSHLAKMKSLRLLHLYRTEVSASAAAQLQTALPECVVLHESLDDVVWRPRSPVGSKPE